MEFKDYYATLGVAKSASADEIKQAYRRLAKRHHPDLHVEKDKAAAAGKFKEANEAYEVLSDPSKKAKYDQLGPDWEAGPRPAAREGRAPHGFESDETPEGFDGFSDFFEQVFGRAARGGGRSAGGSPRGAASSWKGQDVEAELSLPLEDCLRPGDRKLSMRVPAVCPRCGGAGRLGSRVCPQCAGLGEAVQEKSVNVHLPESIRDGMRLRLRGQGGPAPGGGTPGDLYLTIRLLPHARFKVSGPDLETDVTLMPWEASLGGEVAVPSLEGSLRVRVPPGTHAGRRLRLAGKGLPKEGGGRGDLYAVARIDIAARSDARTERLYRELREAAS